jgi:hypothetical protein
VILACSWVPQYWWENAVIGTVPGCALHVVLHDLVRRPGT